MKNTKRNLRALCECGVFAAAALALSFFKIKLGGFGGSVDLVMLPIIICAARWGLGWGLATGLVVGTLKIFISGAEIYHWAEIFLDYGFAYMLVGLAGLLKNKPYFLWLGALVGCIGRMAMHWVSGVTIWAAYMPDTFLGLPMDNVGLYSLLYNGTYMLPNTILAVVLCFILQWPLKKYILNSEVSK